MSTSKRTSDAAPADAIPQWDKFENQSEAESNRDGRRDTAEEEMQRFRHVPVVGRLPWRRQYMVVAIALVLAILVLIQQSVFQARPDVSAGGQVGLELSLRQATAAIRSQAEQATSAQGVDSAQLNTWLNTGDSAVAHLGSRAPAPVQGAWTQLRAAAQALPTATQAAPEVGKAAKALADQLAQRLPALGQAVNSTGDEGAQAAYRDLQRWQIAAEDLAARGRSLNPQAAVDRADLETRLRAFYAAPTADARATAWNGLLQVFGAVKNAMDQVLAAQPTWLQADQAAWKVISAGQALDTALVQMPANDLAGEQSSHLGVWLSGLMAALCLGLLTWIGWRQQQWQTLQARAEAERMEGAIFDLVQQLHQVARGNLTVQSKVADPVVGAVAESINHTVQELRGLAVKVQGVVSRTTAVSNRAEQASTALAEETRRHAQGLTTSSQDILKLARALKGATQSADQVGALTETILALTQEGNNAIQDSRDSLDAMRDRAEDALVKVRRLGENEQQASEYALSLLDLAERIGLLAVQADTRAARAGESGAGFAVVARGMRELASQAAESAKRLQGLAETGRSEVEGILQVIEAANQKNEDLARLNDVAQEAWLGVGEQITRLTVQTNDLSTRVREQQPVAEILERRTQESLEMGEQTRQRVQDAGQTVEELVRVVQDLGDSVRRFQV